MFIDCDSPSIPPLDATKARLRQSAAGWKVHTLHTGHDPFVTAPQHMLMRIG